MPTDYIDKVVFHDWDLRADFSAKAGQRAAESVSLKARLDDLVVRIAAAQAKHGVHPV